MATRTISVNASGNITAVPRSWPWSVFAALNQIRTLTDELKTDRTAMKTAADAVETLIEELHDDGGTRATWETEVDSDLDDINNYLASIAEQDGVIGGERHGPLTPDSKKCGLIIAGFNPCAVDVVCTRLMGFDCRKVKLGYILIHSELFYMGLSNIKILSHRNFDNLFDAQNDNMYIHK
ncbi:hypothetical protein LCGC14_2258110 [marine sediment metagenome]|uniref:Uncharacterized protein n=1 Tax=marine sediment metagenome TaxID=412755 RepID=A0A0F9D0U8_9ZZZZ